MALLPVAEVQRADTSWDHAAVLLGFSWVAFSAAFSCALTAWPWAPLDPLPVNAFRIPPVPLPAPTPNRMSPPPKMMARAR